MGGDSIGRFLPQQVESSAALHRLFPCRLDRFLERRLPGFNPVSKSLAKHADRTEFHRTAFHQLLASFGSTPPLRRASAYAKPGCANAFCHLTEGVTVRVCRLLEEAAVQAIASGGERIELETLSEEVVTANLVSISDRRMRRTAA